MKYYPLHVHTTTGSVGDSILKVRDYIKQAKEYELDSIAITDHGSLAAMYDFYYECKKEGLRPIIGMEAYVCSDSTLKSKENNSTHHLVLLAKNNEGLENIIKLHNKAVSEGYYYVPRTDWNELRNYGKGIIALSACVGGEIPQLILANELEEAKEIIKYAKDIFDEFYLEIQPGTFEEQVIVNDALVDLSKETNTKLVVTNDIHYLSEEDYKIHDYHVKLSRKVKDDNKLIYPDTTYWFMDKTAVLENFIKTDKVTDELIGEAIKNTELIAKQCHVTIPEDIYMPTFHTENNQSEEGMLYDLCFNALNEILPAKKDPFTYIKRLEHELKVIKEKGFCGYFLIVHDYINWANQNDIAVGPGRGSVGGSLVAHLLGISKADPIENNLMFERFLDPNRDSIPDIDVDFSCLDRDKMFNYIKDKYGSEKCAIVSTFHYRKARSAIRDAVRVLGLSAELGDKIAELIPTVYYSEDGEKTTELSLWKALQVVKKLQEYKNEYPEIFEVATKIEGLPSATAIHPAGIIISPVNLDGKLPLIKSNKEGLMATSLPLQDVEKHFVKFDFLSLASLSVIRDTEKDLKIEFDYSTKDAFDDDKVWELIGSEYTTGLFQISSPTYKKRLPYLKPKNIQELATVLALLRGPCISAGTDKKYIKIINGEEKVEKIHPIYDEITKDTHGILIFQEQVMNLAVAFGMSLSDGYKLLKASSKKKHYEIAKFKEHLQNLAHKKGCSKSTFEKIFDLIQKSAEYCFNLSHSVSYSYLVYSSAYLKTYFPLEYMSNAISNSYVRGEKDNVRALIKEAKRIGLSILPADINKSNWRCTVENNSIRLGLCSIKALGEKSSKEIISARPFSSMQEAYNKISGRLFNVKSMNISIFSGLFDSIEKDKNRYELYKEHMILKNREAEDKISFCKDFSINTKDTNKILNNKFYGMAI